MCPDCHSQQSCFIHLWEDFRICLLFSSVSANASCLRGKPHKHDAVWELRCHFQLYLGWGSVEKGGREKENLRVSPHRSGLPASMGNGLSPPDHTDKVSKGI